MKNITSRADVFPFPRSFLDHLNRRTKIKLRCRCFVNFFCGDAVFVIFFLRFCGVDSPPMSPSECNSMCLGCLSNIEMDGYAKCEPVPRRVTITLSNGQRKSLTIAINCQCA